MSTAVKTQRTTQGTAQWGREIPEGFEIRSVDIPEALSAGYYEACAGLGRLGVPGLGVTEAERNTALENWKTVDGQVKELVAGAGGDGTKGYRILHTEGKLEFLARGEAAEV